MCHWDVGTLMVPSGGTLFKYGSFWSEKQTQERRIETKVWNERTSTLRHHYRNLPEAIRSYNLCDLLVIAGQAIDLSRVKCAYHLSSILACKLMIGTHSGNAPLNQDKLCHEPMRNRALPENSGQHYCFQRHKAHNWLEVNRCGGQCLKVPTFDAKADWLDRGDTRRRTVVFGGSITLPYIANSQLNLYIENKWTPSFGTELPRIYLQRSSFKNILDNTVSAVVRAVICLIVVLDGHILTLSSTIRRVTTLMLCIDMITEFRNGFRKSKGGDRTRIDTQTGFYYASAIWIAVFDNDNSLWNFKIIQILVVLGDMCQQKKTGTTHGASIMVLFLFVNHHIPFQLDDIPGDSSLSDLHRRDVFLELCKSNNTTQEATGEKRAGEGWTRSEITSLMSTIVTPLVGTAVGAFWGSIFAFASPKILQKICTALKDWQMSRPVTSGARWAMDSARPIIPSSPSQMEAGTRIIATQNLISEGSDQGFKEPHILWPLVSEIYYS
ncbi:uncharacterized protein CLUP02_14200 [Colletotrichum lupini]|uniref:Uncharacterized protein n=1 Tax=Colletotrichum lupini TaxID=145971 RepID=A0A9Q8T4J0_9PEZI|nr:uncharacterized protein CLUP02_14200 [Colletotrichum lupini]UQC88675.1 hypothetical protein CLUP02_14200 [Colletotrichum lupini]